MEKQNMRCFRVVCLDDSAWGSTSNPASFRNGVQGSLQVAKADAISWKDIRTVCGGWIWQRPHSFAFVTNMNVGSCKYRLLSPPLHEPLFDATRTSLMCKSSPEAFATATDPRFVSTLDAILTSVARDGLTSNNLVFRYNVDHTEDGVSGEEGTFSICTFWAVEALARAGVHRREYLEKARLMFEQTLGYANHLSLYSEELGRQGEHLGNFPQAFTHLALISAAFNLDRAIGSAAAGGDSIL